MKCRFKYIYYSLLINARCFFSRHWSPMMKTMCEKQFQLFPPERPWPAPVRAGLHRVYGARRCGADRLLQEQGRDPPVPPQDARLLTGHQHGLRRQEVLWRSVGDWIYSINIQDKSIRNIFVLFHIWMEVLSFTVFLWIIKHWKAHVVRLSLLVLVYLYSCISFKCCR